ncbi:40S ribosomal protein S8 [Merluccius polli]|uniref:40S ribosomal protein S8 n=1 Tax=Merluccius polli TaxID=89951 RepID=A0AA47MRH9_MERPO|nr:40S ribosomal protein S8 [Merluccius polli]
MGTSHCAACPELAYGCSGVHTTIEANSLGVSISRDNWHKRRKTGGKRKPYHKKRQYELGRPPANRKIVHIQTVVCGCTRKTRIIDVVYNASNNELVRTKTLVKNCIVHVGSLPFRQWYEAHYATPMGRKKGAKLVRIIPFLKSIYSACGWSPQTWPFSEDNLSSSATECLR